MLVRDLVFLSENKVEDIEFRKIIEVKPEISYTSIQYKDCKDNEVIGFVAENNKLVITVFI